MTNTNIQTAVSDDSLLDAAARMVQHVAALRVSDAMTPEDRNIGLEAVWVALHVRHGLAARPVRDRLRRCWALQTDSQPNRNRLSEG